MLCQISKFDFEMFLFNLASENLTVTIKWKIKKNCLLSLRQDGMSYLNKLKSEEKLKLFPLTMQDKKSKTVLQILGAK